MQGIIKKTYFDYATNKQMILIETSNKYVNKIEKLIDKEVDFEKHIEKRSLQANAYFWKLCTEIADVLGSTKEEVHLIELKRYGQSMLIPVVKDSKPDGYFKYYDFESRRELNGVVLDFYKVYKGSSDHDKREMSILIQGVEEDAKELGIEVLSELEFKKLIEEWE